MAISLITQPKDWGRVFDTNRLTYQFSSSNWTQPNFQFQFVLKYYTYDGWTKELGTYNLYPISGGTCEFNPSSIYRNFVKEEINLSDTNLEECLTMALRFQLFVYEYYGTPPVRINTGNWYESTPRTYFNGCQQPIPYDYMGLNPDGNALWVMSGTTTSSLSGTTGGKFLTDANRYELDNDEYLFLYALGDNICGRPDKIRYRVWHSTWTQGTNTQTIGGGGSGIQLAANIDGQENLQMSLPSLDTKNIATGGDSSYIGGGGGGGISIIQSHSGISVTTIYDDNFSFTYTNTRAYRFPCGPKQLINYNGVLSGFTNTWIRYEIDLVKNGSYNDYCYSNTSANNLLMPVGSMIYEAQNEGVFALLSSGGTVIDGDVSHPGTGPWSHRSGPIYYSKTSTSLLTLNRVPFQVFKKDKCNRYDRVQIFFLNKHGGFDTFTFSAKKEINQKINRTTYKQKLPTSSYSPYDAGERVFNVNYQEEYTLRTNSVTQMESQILMGLYTSPVVYMLQTFYYNDAWWPYGVPMIVVSDSVRYEQKKNDKIIYYEIKLRPSNESIVQQG